LAREHTWLTGALAPQRAQPPRPEPLSAREQDVLERLAQLMSTEEIAADLHLSVNTVKTHLKSIYRKLAATRRGEAVRRARDLGLL
ncbi:LuxR C-terminal-related transcriptional regulator, partial [Streptomyces sp. NPDC006356]